MKERINKIEITHDLNFEITQEELEHICKKIRKSFKTLRKKYPQLNLHIIVEKL